MSPAVHTAEQPVTRSPDDDWWSRSQSAAQQAWQKSSDAMDGMMQWSQETFSTEQSDPTFARVWDNVTPTLQAVIDLENEQATLPESAWFSRDQADNHSDINALLSKAVSLLSRSATDDSRQRILKLTANIREARDRIAAYRQARISAPTQSVWKTTVAGYDEKIADEQAYISELETAIVLEKQSFAEQLKTIGMPMSDEQLDLLLSSIVGDDIIQSGIVYDNVREISQRLMQLTVESGEDLAVSKRYYGMYTVLLEVLLHMQSMFIQRVDEMWLPKVMKIMTDVQVLRSETRDLLRNSDDSLHKRHLQANLQAQSLTLETAALYRRHLMMQREKMQLAQERTLMDMRVARNTYTTVTTSGELVNLLRNSEQSFELLLNIQVPELLMFESLQMKQEFAALTTKIGQ